MDGLVVVVDDGKDVLIEASKVIYINKQTMR